MMTKTRKRKVSVGLLLGSLVACGGDGRPPPLELAPEARALGPRVVRRLSPREYALAVESLLGVVPRGARFPEEASVSGFDNAPHNAVVSPEFARVSERLAWELAEQADAQQVYGGCSPKLATDCEDAITQQFLVRAFRRSPTPSERAGMLAVYREAFAAGGVRLAQKTLVATVLQAPAFLYREELGEDDPARSGRRVSLTDFEVAQFLAFSLTGGPPDDALLGAAREQKLGSREARELHARRLAGTPRGRSHLVRFMHQWLGTSRLATLPKDRAAFPAYGEVLRNEMREELDALYEEILDAREGGLRALLTTTRAVARGELAALYGLPPQGEARVSLDPATRAGILTRAGFLATHASIDGSNPVGRGVFVLSHLLCAEPAAPPPGIARVPPETPGARTTRERFAAHASHAACRACHVRIDGIGFGLEAFDGIGRLRTHEGGVPIDARGWLSLEATGDTPVGVDGAFDGAVGLQRALLSEPALHSCFTRKLYRWVSGNGEGREQAPWLTQLSASSDLDTPLRERVISMVIAEAARHRSVGTSP
jgi:hypothetical protein